MTVAPEPLVGTPSRTTAGSIGAANLESSVSSSVPSSSTGSSAGWRPSVSPSEPTLDHGEKRAQAAERARRYRAKQRDAAVTDTVTLPTPATVSVTPSVMVGMTRTERDDLAKVARLRARVARSTISVREAELLADVEAKLSAEYEFADEAWADVTAAGVAGVAAANERIREVCRERGIPEKFSSSLRVYWEKRGENATASRRVELRRLAQTRIAALGKAAKLAIETREAEVVIELLAGGLASAEARAYLDSIPTPEQLMAPVNLTTLEGEISQPRARWLEDYS